MTDFFELEGVNEEWRVIPSEPHLEASSEGRIRRVKDWKLLKQRIGYWGYPQVNINHRVNGKTKCRTVEVHILVMEAFYGAHDGLEIDHIRSKNKDDASLDNLRLVTHRENIMFRDDLGPRPLRPIDVYDTNGNFLIRCRSLNKAAEYCQCGRTTIFRHLDTQTPTQKGYVLKDASNR